MEENFLIRNVFNRGNINTLGEKINRYYPSFQLKEFLEALIPAIDDMTFSERKIAITKALERYLPSDFKKSLDILLNALPPPYETNDIDDSTDRFIVAASTKYVSRNGMSDPELSMKGLYTMTQSLTAEWDVRPFIKQYPDLCKKFLLDWSMDKNAHVRRLVSEGTRPYVPWGQKLELVEKDPDWSLELLQNIKTDESLFVRRSVANHLNDLSKKHPKKVVSVLQEWNKSHQSSEMSVLTKHALRTLIKKGNRDALELLGYPSEIHVEIKKVNIPDGTPREGTLSFTMDMVSTSDSRQKILVDYAIHFLKANGNLQPKVFKLSTFNLESGSSRTITKSFSFRPITTRKYYIGPHKIEILVNGQSMLLRSFNYG